MSASATPRVLVLGGEGRVGQRIARLLADEVSVTVADRRASTGSGPGMSLKLDVADGDGLRRALDSHDVVVNTVGPYEDWGTHILDLAIAAQTHYVDICDDARPTLKMLERNDAAVARGVTAVIGMGASPGLSNILAAVAVDQLDEAITVVNYWGKSYESLSLPETRAFAAHAAQSLRQRRAAFEHMVAQAVTPASIWRDGGRVEVPAWTDRYQVSLAGGGIATFRLVAHPEPLTLPMSFQLREAFCIGTLGRIVDDALARVVPLVESGDLSLADASGAMADLLDAWDEERAEPPLAAALPAFIGAIARGTREQEPVDVFVLPGDPIDDSMSMETARPAALAVLALDEVGPGVHSPETAFRPVPFLEALASRFWDGGPAVEVRAQTTPAFELIQDGRSRSSQ